MGRFTKMSKSFLVTRPNHDETTNYLFYWSVSVVKAARKRGFSVYDLAGNKANKKQFDSFLKSKKPTLLFLNGHGNATTITGQNLEPLLEVGRKSTVAETIIYARSCDAAIILGKELIKEGAKSFIGYNQKFIFGYTPSKITRPLTDGLAKFFLEPSNLIVTTMIKGQTMQTAQNRSKKAMLKNIEEMSLFSAPKENKYAVRWLWSNYKSQVLYGDAEATY